MKRKNYILTLITVILFILLSVTFYNLTKSKKEVDNLTNMNTNLNNEIAVLKEKVEQHQRILSHYSNEIDNLYTHMEAPIFEEKKIDKELLIKVYDYLVENEKELFNDRLMFRLKLDKKEGNVYYFQCLTFVNIPKTENMDEYVQDFVAVCLTRDFYVKCILSENGDIIKISMN